MHTLRFYEAMARRLPVRYPYKIMLVAFAGTHVPLLVLIAWYALRHSSDWHAALPVIGVALVATLAGTGVTLLVLSHLLRPVLLASAGLRAYAAHRQLPVLPTGHTDEAGTLMADTAAVLAQLDATRTHAENYDDLSGLPRRKLLVQRLSERVSGGMPHGVCILVLRNAQRVAAAYGQEAEHVLVRAMAAHLSATVPQMQPSRIGTAVLALLLDGVSDGGDAQAQVAELLRGLPREYRVNGGDVHLDIAAGVGLYPGDGSDAEAILNSAFTAAVGNPARDEALPGGAPTAASVAFFSASSRDEVRRRFQMEQDLRLALERGEFSLHYQPVVDVASGQVVGAEALMRWRHPERGMVPPGSFIPVAEACGLIEPMSRWVLQQACQQLQAWTGTPLEPLYIAINLSAGQFLADDLVGTIDRALYAHGILPSRLEIEFTESVAMTDAVRTSSTLAALRGLGVRSAIDDFGTGYSSLAYLQTLPVDKLKIDRAFVSDVHGSRAGAAICKSLVELGRGLNLVVVAEGAESRDEVEYLGQMGCQVFQGFYFARPMPAEQLLEFLAKTSAASLRLGG